MPVLVLVGADDHKYRDIARNMQRAIGDNAEVSVVAQAGHTAHLEQPQRVARQVLEWLGANRLITFGATPR